MPLSDCADRGGETMRAEAQPAAMRTALPGDASSIGRPGVSDS